MGLNVARMGRVEHLNYGLENRGRRFLGGLLGVYINSLLKWIAAVFRVYPPPSLTVVFIA